MPSTALVGALAVALGPGVFLHTTAQPAVWLPFTGEQPEGPPTYSYYGAGVVVSCWEPRTD